MTTPLAQSAVFRMLARLEHGGLEVICPDRTHVFGDPAADLQACIAVHHPRFFSRLLLGGDDAAGDAYVDGDWSSPDPVAVVRLAARNLATLEGGHPLLSLGSRLYHRARHWTNRNTEGGSRRNIQAHYDLSNDFFRLFLDQRMVYSSAIYTEAAQSLEDAQLEKLDRICRKLRLGPSDHVLEIGTGWGAFALHASRRYGCRVTTTTISQEQHDEARRLFAGAGDAGARITLRLDDYRQLSGTYSKIVSIEMFEAVGLEYYDTFFGACDRLLAPDGSMLLQTITMNEQRFDAYRRQSDWIQRRIFPGSQLASVRAMLDSLVRVTRLSAFNLEDIGLHYAVTLAEWRRRFHAAGPGVRALGFDARFCRMWDYYLAYCEGAFRERHISNVQLLLTKNASLSPLLGDPPLEVGAGRRRVGAAAVGIHERVSGTTDIPAPPFVVQAGGTGMRRDDDVAGQVLDFGDRRSEDRRDVGPTASAGEPEPFR
jgi:cyclopropane-fatty-acyl-phospholipid synthase